MNKYIYIDSTLIQHMFLYMFKPIWLIWIPMKVGFTPVSLRSADLKDVDVVNATWMVKAGNWAKEELLIHVGLQYVCMNVLIYTYYT